MVIIKVAIVTLILTITIIMIKMKIITLIPLGLLLRLILYVITCANYWKTQ